MVIIHMENKKKVLVVEDESVLSTMYKTKLEAEGCEVMTADNGSDALRLAKEAKVDLILLDVILPQLDGFSVLSEVKADPEIKDTPVIMLTNLGTEEDRQKGERLGAADYLVKANLTPEQVMESIKKFLNN